ncbi:MAG: hypothetical protein WBM40_21490 [Thiohalocapsa sp.]
MTIPLLLRRRHRVPWLWLISPEDSVLIAQFLDGDNYRVIATLKKPDQANSHARVAPVDAIELDRTMAPRLP